jgi:hypothetical protein
MGFSGNFELWPRMRSARSILIRSLAGLRRLGRLAAETRGAEIAEAAAVLPLMFMMLLGIFWFGQAFSIYGAITRAAQEGARAGAFPSYATCTSCTNSLSQYATDAVTATNNALLASNLNPILAHLPSTAPTFNYCATGLGTSGGCGPSANICVQAPVQMANLATGGTGGGTGVCGIAVTFQYPFQFWLPFTSLNKQTIWLTAQARARMETH